MNFVISSLNSNFEKVEIKILKWGWKSLEETKAKLFIVNLNERFGLLSLITVAFCRMLY
jgi:hypothetical protein